MKLFLCFCWTFCVVASVLDMRAGAAPDWFMVIVPCAALAFNNLADWLNTKTAKYMKEHPNDK